jgi:hypothetical protein
LLLAVGIIVALLVPNVAAQQREPRRERTFDDLLSIAGLAHLSAEDKERVQNLLQGLNRAAISDSEEKAGAFDSIVDYLQAQGFEPELVMSSVRDQQPILIVGRILREFTVDIPESLSTGEWKNGVYFVRWTDDGASEIIVSGEVHDFTQSLWLLFSDR